MRNFLFTAVVVLSTTISFAQTTTITVDNAGKLSSAINAEQKYKITSLKIKGELNGTDIILLREMAGIDQDNNPTDGKLSELDIAEAKIVEGGEAYLSDFNLNIDFFTANDEIGDRMFADCKQLISITIPQNTIAIGDSAFINCVNLTHLTLPASIKQIRTYAFANTAFTTFDYPSNVPLSEGLFDGCKNLNAFSLNSNHTVLPKKIFSGTNITNIVFPETLTEIGESAFEYCPLKSLTFPSTLKSIGHSAFRECNKLEQLKINDGLESIGYLAFSYCEMLESVFIPNSVTHLEGAFSNCKKLKTAHLPEGLTEISNSMFDRCDNLKTVNVPPMLKKIGDLAFQNNTKLESFPIPKHVTTIGKKAFSNCKSLSEIILPDEVTSIGKNCFEGCSNAETIILSKSLKEIPENAFSYCESITELEIVSGITKIDNKAFMYCEALEKLTLPESVISIGTIAFIGSMLKNIYNYATNPAECGKKAFGTDDDEEVPEGCKLYVPKGTKSKYETADIWSNFEIEEFNTTDISSNKSQNNDIKETARYNINGQKIQSKQRGINIIKMSDGHISKMSYPK